MKYIFSVIFCIAILTSCSESTQNNNNSSLTTAELSIKGMTCEKMCGGAICKGLEKLDGVENTDLLFDSENPIDKVTVTFDPSIISTAEMTKKIESLAGGMYKVQ